MAVSSSFDFNLDRDTAIEVAMRHCGLLADGESPGSNELTDISRVLNIMLKSWPTNGTQLHLQQRIFLFLQDEQREYDLGHTASNSDECTTQFYATYLDGAHSEDATAITVENGTNISNSDRIGIEMDDGTLHWTTVSAGGGTTSLTIATGIDDDAADGNVVYTYTNKARRPERILRANVKTAPTQNGSWKQIDGTETPVDMIDRTDWMDLSQKDTAEGRVNQLWYEPNWPTAVVRIWPEPEPATDYLVLWCERTTDDLDAATDDFSLPQAWYAALTWELALWICPMFGVSQDTFAKVQFMANKTLQAAESSDTESGMEFSPDDRGEGYY